jgi:hypothetical protein
MARQRLFISEMMEDDKTRLRDPVAEEEARR